MPRTFWLFFFGGFLFCSCNTLYNTHLVDIEIVEPAGVIFPPEIKTLALKYNNSNISYNPYFAKYTLDNEIKSDASNIDSTASEVYFKSFAGELQQSFLFDSVFVLQPRNYSNYNFEIPPSIKNDTLEKDYGSDNPVQVLAGLHEKFTQKTDKSKRSVVLNPELGLYSATELKEIRDSTGADALWSLDYFGAFEYMASGNWNKMAIFIMPLWNFYDLRKTELQFYYNKIDTFLWESNWENQKFPPRDPEIKDVALNSGQQFAGYLVPHWIPVQRTIYKSGHFEMKQAQALTEKNQWLKAAEIWKKNINNPNKNIAAKSRFNLGLACEIEGNLDAAIDWTVKSYQVFGIKNEIHSFNCQDYLRILKQRKLDLKKIELEVNREPIIR